MDRSCLQLFTNMCAIVGGNAGIGEYIIERVARLTVTTMARDPKKAHFTTLLV